MIDMSVCIVAYRNYEDIKVAVESLEHFAPRTMTKKVYIVDNSCYKNEEPLKTEFTTFLSKWKDVDYIDTKENLGFGKLFL